jgi:drug/metabolite transporter (DMT)-like permease
VDKLKARLVLFYGVLSVTSSSFIIRAAYSSLGYEAPYVLAFIRVLSTGLISLIILSSITGRKAVSDKREYFMIFLAGFSLATHFGWWFDSLRYVPIGISLSLTNTAPVWLTLFVFLFYKKIPTQKQYLAIIFVIVGSIIIFVGSFEQGINSLLGVSLALASAIGFALYLLIARDRVQKYGLWFYFGLVNIAAASTLLVWLILLNQIHVLLDPEIWFWGILLSIFPGVMGHALYNWAMSRLDSIDVGIATLGEPVLGTILAVFLLQEILKWNELLGITFLIIAIALTLEIRFNLKKLNKHKNEDLPKV